MLANQTFLPFGVSPDFMDARINVLWASAPSTILPDTTYYAEDHPQREELLTLWKETSANLLKAYDFSDAEIEDLLEKRLELDRRVAAVVLSNERKFGNMLNSTIHMITKISRNLRLPSPWMTSSKPFLAKYQTRLS